MVMVIGKDALTQKSQTFDLDSSAIIYAATQKKEWNRTFRVAATLKQKVEPKVLAKAIADLQPRFPTLYVQLETGFFDYKVRTVHDTAILTQESAYPCRPVLVGRGEKPMFRVTYFENRIAIEIFHLVTDGTGVMCLLKSILARYLELQGFQVDKTDGVLSMSDVPSEHETEDSFKKLKCENTIKVSRNEAPAYKYFPQDKDNYFKLTHGYFSVEELKTLTKAKSVTVTEYLVALYAWAFYNNMLPEKSEKPIKISVPTDLRRLFASTTLRNFSLFTNVSIYPQKKDYTFDEFLQLAKQQMNEGFKKETLLSAACKNVTDANMAVFRYMPLSLKKAILKIGYALLGDKLITSSMSSLGIVTVPKGMGDHVDHFDMISGGTLKNFINCGILSFNGVMNVNFSSRCEATDIQRIFFTYLSERGVNIEVQSNVEQKAVNSTTMRHCGNCKVEFKDNHLHCPLCGGQGVTSEKKPISITAPYPEY